MTDEKLKTLEKEGSLIWENNNWFEVIWTRDDKEGWESVDNTVKYDYDEALQLFNEYYNRTDITFMDSVPDAVHILRKE